MWELAERRGFDLCTYVPYAAAAGGFLHGAVTTVMSGQRPPLPWSGSHFAILIYQGSDPTQPYPTLVIRQSATLPNGFAPRGRSTLFGPRP